MKIKHQIALFITVLVLLVLFLGITAIRMQRLLSASFDEYAGNILPSAIEAVRIKTDIERVAEFAKLYEVTGDAEYRWQAWTTLKKMQRNLEIYKNFSLHHIPDTTLEKIDLHTHQFINYSKEYLQMGLDTTKEKMLDLNNKMHDEKIIIKGIITPLINNDVIATKAKQDVLVEQAEKAHHTILSVIIVILFLLIIITLVSFFSVVRPIKRLIAVAEEISSGNAQAKMPNSLMRKTNELGILARSLDQTVSSLIEVAHSRDDLNIEINERLEAEVELLKEKFELELQKNSVVGEQKNINVFVQKIIEVLRSPINGILGFSEMIQNYDRENIKDGQYIGHIKENAMQLARISDDILDFIALENQVPVPQYKQFRVKPLCEELIGFYKEKCTKDVEIRCDIETSVDIISQDKKIIKQILRRCLDNAVRYVNSGEIVLICKQTGKERIEFIIRDTGIGIPEYRLEKIFETYLYNDTVESGIGLGLAITERMVRLLGGTISVRSSPGEGTEVKIVCEEQYEKTEAEQSESFFYDINWKKKSIMIVDDEEINRVLLRESLDKTGANLIFADNGSQAIEIFKKNRPDVVLMDIKMPLMDGYQTTIELKEINKDIPVIANTAYAFFHEREKALSAGCDDYIAKPFNQLELVKLIEKYINR